MAQAAKGVIWSTVSLERVRAIRSPNGRLLSVSAAMFTKEMLPLARFELGSPVLSKRLECSPGDKSFKGVLYGRICSSKGQHSTDDGSTSCNPPSKTPSLPPCVPSRTSDEVGAPDCADAALVGEDAAAFDITSQSTSSWLLFTAILGVVLAILNVVWIDPEAGYGSEYIDAISSLSSSHEVVMLIIFFTFALVHSGLASLRGAGEKLIGERAYRVIYAASSLPLAVSAVVAAVDKPKVHMWETGIMRITRHRQMVGQFLWCFAHTL